MLTEPIEPRYPRKFELAGLGHPVAVLESDDWGSCETIAKASQIPFYKSLMEKYGNPEPYLCRMEGADDIRRIAGLLEKHHGADGLSPVLTAFTCVANPDYDAIEASGFTRYADIPISRGLPPTWEAPGLVEAMREAERRMVWQAEYHTRLHHTSTKLWLKYLRENRPECALVRELFKIKSYYITRHLPEFHGFDNYREIFNYIAVGIGYFEEIFGRRPTVAITSDAYDEIEFIWSCLGIRTIALKNNRVNSGMAYAGYKYWNNQDYYAKPGDYNPDLDVIYLTRNVFAEIGHKAEDILHAAEERIRRFHEPITISTHRIVYCNLDEGLREQHFQRLEDVLSGLDAMGVVYLSSSELGDLYHQGWSLRPCGEKTVFHRCAEDAVNVPEQFAALPLGTHVIRENPQARM